MLVHTLPSTLRAMASVLMLLTTARAFQVAQSSPCSSQCTIDGAVNINVSEVVCSDTDFSTTSTGLKFKNCIDCLQTSSHFSADDSDVAWFLYNIRFAADVCLFRYPEADPKNATSACNVDYVCNPLRIALEADKLSIAAGNQFEYCTADNSAFRGQSRATCIGCLQGSPSNRYLSNFLLALEAGCEQLPVPGKLLGLNGTLFSQTAINITNAEGASNATAGVQNNSPAHLSVGAIIGITVGAAALFLGGAILFAVYYCRQRRYNKEDRARRASYASYHGYPTYPSYPEENTDIALEGPSYTLDYKSPTQDHETVDEASEDSYGISNYAHRRQPSVHSRQLSGEELQRSPSAMPIHPAYIPRAIIRRNSPSITNPSQFSSTQHSRNPSFDSQAPIALSSPPPARRPSRVRATDSSSIHLSSHSATGSTASVDNFTQRRDRQTPVPLTIDPTLDTDIHRTAVRQLEQHGIYAADQQEPHQPPPQQQQPNPQPQYHQQLQQQQQQPSPHHLPSLTAGPGPTTNPRPRATSTSSSKSSPSSPHHLQQPLPIHASRSRRPQPPPPLSLAQGTSKPRQQQQKTPPFQQQQKTPPFQQQKTPPFHQQAPRRNDAPLPGLQDIEISGPLAFRDRDPHPPNPYHHRAFRDRPVPDGGPGGHGTVGPGAARFAGNAGGGGGGGGLHFQDRIVEQNFIRKGWAGEVPLESAREDLW